MLNEKEPKHYNEYKLEFYVLNGNFNDDKIEKFNIFNNYWVRLDTVKLLNKYYAGKIKFDDFVEELRKTVQWQEWSRCEYEILVQPWVSKSDVQPQKIDCYQQFEPNARLVAMAIIKENRPIWAGKKQTVSKENDNG